MLSSMTDRSQGWLGFWKAARLSWVRCAIIINYTVDFRDLGKHVKYLKFLVLITWWNDNGYIELNEIYCWSYFHLFLLLFKWNDYKFTITFVMCIVFLLNSAVLDFFLCTYKHIQAHTYYMGLYCSIYCGSLFKPVYIDLHCSFNTCESLRIGVVEI